MASHVTWLAPGGQWFPLGLGLLVLGLAGVPVFASSEAPSAPVAKVASEASWDWGTGEFRLTLTLPLPQDTEATPPRRRYLAEREAERLVTQEFVKRAGALPVASGKTLAEVMAEDPSVEAGVAQLGESLKFVSSRVDDEYTNLEMVWSVGLWDGLGALLSEVPEPNPVPPLIRWAPSRDFSGLVVFAMGDLPWVGTGLKARWAPSLTFRLLNPRGEVVYDPTMNDPGYFHQWGQSAVSLGRFNEGPYQDRIGLDPLRIVARGVWGARPGDLVLAESDWERILSRDANRKLLTEGRVLVLYGPFPDYVDRPNPDSAIDLEKPAVEVIPEPPPPSATPAGGGGGH